MLKSMQNPSEQLKNLWHSFHPTFRRSPSTRLTISLGGNSLKVVAVEGDVVKGWSLIPFNPRFVRDDVVSDPQALSLVIRSAVERLGLNQRRVVGALPGHRSLIRTLTLPKIDGVSYDELVPREARRAIGPAIDDYYLQLAPLEKRGLAAGLLPRCRTQGCR